MTKDYSYPLTSIVFKVKRLSCSFYSFTTFCHCLSLQWKDEVVDVAMKMLQPVHPGVEADLPLMQQYQVRLCKANRTTMYGSHPQAEKQCSTQKGFYKGILQN